MAQEKWALRPGEKTLVQSYLDLQQETLEKKYHKLVDDYISKSDRRPIVLDDNREIVYFITYKEDSEYDTIDVAVYNGNEYLFLSENLAWRSTQSYIAYIEAIAEVYDYTICKLEGDTV